jgi:hypothetical protein
MFIRLATDSEIKEIWQLTHDEYVRKRYIEPQPHGMYSHYEHLEDTLIYVALEDNEIIGTVSVTFDGPNGLPSDIDFPEETFALRTNNILAAAWRIITKRSSPKLITALQRRVFETLIAHDSPLLVCIVNPRHVSYYTRVLGFKQIATGMSEFAPAVLMVHDVKKSVRKWLDD